MSISAPDLVQQPAPLSVQILKPSLAFNPAHVLSLDQVLAALKKCGVSKQFCEMSPDELEAVLVKQGLQVDHGDTKAIAAIHQIKPQTALKNLSRFGTLYGLRATKLPNRKLDWLLIRVTQRGALAANDDRISSANLNVSGAV